MRHYRGCSILYLEYDVAIAPESSSGKSVTCGCPFIASLTLQALAFVIRLRCKLAQISVDSDTNGAYSSAIRVSAVIARHEAIFLRWRKGAKDRRADARDDVVFHLLVAK